VTLFEERRAVPPRVTLSNDEGPLLARGSSSGTNNALEVQNTYKHFMEEVTLYAAAIKAATVDAAVSGEPATSEAWRWLEGSSRPVRIAIASGEIEPTQLGYSGKLKASTLATYAQAMLDDEKDARDKEHDKGVARISRTGAVVAALIALCALLGSIYLGWILGRGEP
jgi:hypothetical protein